MLSVAKMAVDSQVEKRIDLRTRFAWRAGYLLAAFGIYMADQASKAWAVKMLRFGEERVRTADAFTSVAEGLGRASAALQKPEPAGA